MHLCGPQHSRKLPNVVYPSCPEHANVTFFSLGPNTPHVLPYLLACCAMRAFFSFHALALSHAQITSQEHEGASRFFLVKHSTPIVLPDAPVWYGDFLMLFDAP
jgi:hypothetical protein